MWREDIQYSHSSSWFLMVVLENLIGCDKMISWTHFVPPGSSLCLLVAKLKSFGFTESKLWIVDACITSTHSKMFMNEKYLPFSRCKYLPTASLPPSLSLSRFVTFLKFLRIIRCNRFLFMRIWCQVQWNLLASAGFGQLNPVTPPNCIALADNLCQKHYKMTKRFAASSLIISVICCRGLGSYLMPGLDLLHLE